MKALSTNDLLGRLGPSCIEYFKDRATVDFRVFPGAPDKLLVFVRFPDARGHWGDLELLKALADDAGFHIDGAGANHNSAWIEIPVRAPSSEIEHRDNVVPFRARRLRPA